MRSTSERNQPAVAPTTSERNTDTLGPVALKLGCCSWPGKGGECANAACFEHRLTMVSRSKGRCPLGEETVNLQLRWVRMSRRY